MDTMEIIVLVKLVLEAFQYLITTILENFPDVGL